MSHLEEGMIHTWLDDELSASEGAALQAHAAECATCAALIAEARGLMAASTRILGALDDVPSGVIPNALGSAAASPSSTAPSLVNEARVRPALKLAGGTGAREQTLQTRAKRSLFRHPRFAAAAALLVIAVGTWNVRQRMSGEAVKASPQVVDARNDLRSSDLMDSGALGRVASTAEAPASAPPPSLAPLRKADAPARRGAVLGAASATPASDKLSSATGAADAAGASDKLSSATRAADSARADEQRRLENSNRTQPVVASPPLPSPVATSAVSRSSDTVRAEAAKMASEPKRLALSPDSLISKERDRIAGEVRTQSQGARQAAAGARPRALSEVVTTGAAADEAAAGKAAMACFDLARGVAALEQRVPPRVQLLESRGPTAGERLWKQVRVLGNDPGTDEWFWWVRPDGALVLARLEGGAVRYEVAVSGPTAREVRASQQKCP